MLTGSLVAPVSSFDERGQVDHPAVEKLIEIHVDQESGGLVIGGIR